MLNKLRKDICCEVEIVNASLHEVQCYIVTVLVHRATSAAHDPNLYAVLGSLSSYFELISVTGWCIMKLYR